MQGNRAYYGLHRLLRSRRLRARTNLGSFERRMQTLWACLSDASSGGVFEHGAWMRRMNHELAELCGEPRMLTVAKAGRIRWLEDVMRMPPRRSPVRHEVQGVHNKNKHESPCVSCVAQKYAEKNPNIVSEFVFQLESAYDMQNTQQQQKNNPIG